jgi:TetR/AcrR family transcriptional regulator, mexJK operon transcriptional repressor
MKSRQNERTQQTRERLRAAAHRLFLQHGYQATSIDAILQDAGISSKETFYRHYSSKEALFVDVLSHLTMEQPGFSEKLAALPTPDDLASLHQALLQLSREILSMMYQPGYLPLVRMIIAESSRFPQLGTLFFSTVTQRGLDIITSLLQVAKERQIIAAIDYDAVTRMLLGGLLSYAIIDLIYAGEQAQPPPLERADALIEVIMRALTL